MLDTLSLRKQPAWERTNKLEGAVGAVGRFSLIRTFQADHEVPTTSLAGLRMRASGAEISAGCHKALDDCGQWPPGSEECVGYHGCASNGQAETRLS